MFGKDNIACVNSHMPVMLLTYPVQAVQLPGSVLSAQCITRFALPLHFPCVLQGCAAAAAGPGAHAGSAILAT
jgi:hypothetical protein